MKTKVVIICGPTASGKTALAVRLAGNQPTSIISADSRQAYKGLDILTGKDIPINSKKIISSLNYKSSTIPYFEKNNLRFWGYDLLDSNEQYNAADFVDVTSRIIASEKSDGRLVFIVGGTGFYLKALTNPGHLSAVPPEESLRQELEKLPLEKLQVLLREENPVRFNSLNESDVKNPRRLIRAIEVSRHPSSSNQDSITENEYVWVGLRLPINVQEEKIKERIDSRLKLGAIDEVARLLKSTPNQTLPIYTALGVGPIKDYLEGKVTPDELKTLWLTDEMNYSKRQLTWFKKQDQIIWYDQDEAAKLTLPILYENQ